MSRTNNKTRGIELLVTGRSAEDIASELGVKVDTVKGWLREWEKHAREAPMNPESTEDYDLLSRSTNDVTRAGDELDAQASNDASLDPSSGANTEEAEQPNSGAVDMAADGAEGAAVPDEAYKPPHSAQLPVRAGSNTWLLATNHQNMAYMLSADMLMGPSGFGGKHYRDPADVFPGWLPLFRNDVPEAALRDCIRERNDLRPCIAEINVKEMSGLVRLAMRNGEIRVMSLPTKIDDDVVALFVPTPLPTTLLTRLHFRSDDDLKEFQAVCCSGRKIDLSRIELGVVGQFFSGSLEMRWPPDGSEVATASFADDKHPAWGQAIGGVLAMLYHLANRSDLCFSAYRVIANSDTDGDIDAIKRDVVLRELPHWLASAEISADAPQNARLYWGVAQALITAHFHNSTDKPVDTVLEYLESQSAAETNPDRSRLDRLIKTMKASLGMGKGTISDLLKQHPGSLSRPLLLLCLRERCKDLLEFSHPDLKDEELVLAAILFGIREGGWRKLPLELRGPDALASYAMHRMCTIEQEGRVNGRLTFGSEPPRPKPLRELVTEGAAWSTSLKEDAFGGFARRHGWNDCIVTRIRLPKGEYRLKHFHDGIAIEFQGVAEGVDIEVHKESLINRVAQLPPGPVEIERELSDIMARERGCPCG